MIFIYRYDLSGSYYVYNKYSLSTISNVLPVVNRTLDSLRIPTPSDSAAILYLNDKFPFWKHSILLLCLDKPILLLLEGAVKRNPQLTQAIK